MKTLKKIPRWVASNGMLFIPSVMKANY